MKRLISSMSGNQKGFTLIELLVVVAILGVIAAVVALNVGSFFGRGTVQAANTELHNVQTAIISCMAECEMGSLNHTANGTIWWAGGSAGSPAADCVKDDDENTAAFYVYGPFRAAYQIDTRGRILQGSLNSTVAGVDIGTPWAGIRWSETNKNWEADD